VNFNKFEGKEEKEGKEKEEHRGHREHRGTPRKIFPRKSLRQ
jgi:hypothetical protein